MFAIVVFHSFGKRWCHVILEWRGTFVTTRCIFLNRRVKIWSALARQRFLPDKDRLNRKCSVEPEHSRSPTPPHQSRKNKPRWLHQRVAAHARAHPLTVNATAYQSGASLGPNALHAVITIE